MALEYTEEKLNSLDKETVIQLFLAQQAQLKQIDHTLQLVLEQVADLKRHRFGRSSEKHETENQISFMERMGRLYSLTRLRLLQGKKLAKQRKLLSASTKRKDRGSGKRIFPVFRLQ